ncbi:peptidase S8 [Halobacteriales archaeon SW_6_65_15]|nr:MAG: peptidase S8 [Halobacteriales archaeon SW_6_65_15]
MLGNDNGVSRRSVLKAAGASAGLFGASGLAAADDESNGDNDYRKSLGLEDGQVQINVGFKSDRGRQKALGAADEVVREFNSIDVVTIRASAQAVSGLQNNPNVRYVEEDGQMQALAQTLPWGIDRVDAEVAHANGDTGAGADIAIIDTGIDSDHPDLQANLGKGRAFVNCNTRGGCRFGAKPADNTCHYNWDDDNDHGTHCAGIADAVNNSEGVVGVSTEATLHAVKVLDKCGSGSWSDVAAGIEYVGDQGWDVGSMSLGGDASQTIKDAVSYAHSQGVTLVGAAGNDGPCTDCVGYPAAYSEVIAVSSTNDSDGLSDFSSTGPEVEIAAPGTDIYSTVANNGGYDTFSGTSMACPHVAGAAGQLRANGYSQSDTRSRLKDTAENIGLASNESGAGLLDAAAALGHDSSDN